MADELDLEQGQPGEDEQSGGGSRPPRGESERSQRRRRADIRERLHAVFSRLADALEGRGDVELAGYIREDQKAMVEGLASLVKRAPGLGAPVMGTLAVLEPVIAFGRIIRLLGRRLGERRAAALEERFEDDTRELLPECGVEGCEIVQAHRHEAEGVVYL